MSVKREFLLFPPALNLEQKVNIHFSLAYSWKKKKGGKRRETSAASSRQQHNNNKKS